jgi:hypothetical protein
MMSKILFCFTLATASVKAEAWDLAEDEEFYGEPRLLDSLFNNTGQISMNAILALVLVGVLFLVTSGGSFLGGGSGYNRNSYAGYGDYDYQNYYQDNQFYNRAGHTDDIASKMAQLEQAFKKYQVEEAECEMYIACEASQVQRIEENGPLARIVYDILSTFNRSKDGHKWDDRMNGLVQAFEFGTGASASGQVDPCEPLRNKCFELHGKY